MAALFEAHYGEGDADAIDREWEEFAKLVDLRNKRQEQLQQNTFYPSPATEEDYESTIVRH